MGSCRAVANPNAMYQCYKDYPGLSNRSIVYSLLHQYINAANVVFRFVVLFPRGLYQRALPCRTKCHTYQYKKKADGASRFDALFPTPACQECVAEPRTLKEIKVYEGLLARKYCRCKTNSVLDT